MAKGKSKAKKPRVAEPTAEIRCANFMLTFIAGLFLSVPLYVAGNCVYSWFTAPVPLKEKACYLGKDFRFYEIVEVWNTLNQYWVEEARVCYLGAESVPYLCRIEASGDSVKQDAFAVIARVPCYSGEKIK